MLPEIHNCRKQRLMNLKAVWIPRSRIVGNHSAAHSQFPTLPYLRTLNSTRLSGMPTHSNEKTPFPDHDFLGVGYQRASLLAPDSVAHRRLGDPLNSTTLMPASPEQPPRDGRDRRSVHPSAGDRAREPRGARTGSHPGAGRPFLANRTPRQHRQVPRELPRRRSVEHDLAHGVSRVLEKGAGLRLSGRAGRKHAPGRRVIRPRANG
jgi:hypothetical protein